MRTAGMGVSRLTASSLADVRQQGHEPGPLQGGGDGPLEGGAVAGPLAAEELALAGAELLEALHVLEVDERRPRAALFRAEAAPVLATAAQFLADHRLNRPAVRETPGPDAGSVMVAAAAAASTGRCSPRPPFPPWSPGVAARAGVVARITPIAPIAPLPAQPAAGKIPQMRYSPPRPAAKAAQMADATRDSAAGFESEPHPG